MTAVTCFLTGGGRFQPAGGPAGRTVGLGLALWFVFGAWTGLACGQVGGVLRTGQLLTRGGESLAGRLEKLTEEGLTWQGEAARNFPLADMVRWEFEGRRARLSRESPLVILANGDLLAADVVRADEEELALRWDRLTGLREFAIPLEAVRAVVFRQPTEGELLRDLWRRVEQAVPGADELVLQNGDTLRGELKGVSDRELRLEGENAPGTLGRRGVLAVIFNPELQDLPRLEGAGGLITLTDGSRLHVGGLRLIDGELLGCEALCATPFEFPCAAVVSVQFLGQGCQPLSELEPVESEFTPFLAEDWPWRRDRNCLGQPFQLRGNCHATGLGVHSRQRLTYDLPGRAEAFVATVGIDDSARGRGAVEFAVLVDDQPVWSSGVVRGRDEPRPVPRVSLKGARRLTLLVDFGPEANVLDHADWCDAVLIGAPR